jgi:hypothetical protein
MSLLAEMGIADFVGGAIQLVNAFDIRILIAGEGFEPTTLLSKSLDNTAFFFLCVLVAKVETVILS